MAGDLNLSRVAVLLPALNEANNLAELLPFLRSLGVGQVIVCDNGSSDDTRKVVTANNAAWAYEPKRGYGAACQAGLQSLGTDTDVVVFLDADQSDDPSLLPAVVRPILEDQADLVLAVRVCKWREPGSMSLPQRVANALFPLIIRLGWGYRYTDLAPFRAIRRASMDAVDMQDRAFGWTIEMQIRAVELGLRIVEIPAPYRRRVGRSKISGTLRGVVSATYWITRTCAGLWFTKKHRRKCDRWKCDRRKHDQQEPDQRKSASAVKTQHSISGGS